MLELQHISYEVDGNKEILHDINLTVNERFVAITGPNGGGKSTLAKVIAGIYTPTSGRILLDGEDITNLSITDRAKLGVSYAFQQPVRFKGLRVRDLLAWPRAKTPPSTMPADSFRKSAYVRAIISIVKSMPASRAANSSALRSPWCWHAEPSFPFSTSPKPGSTCGVSRT